jgi:hypothetical protein
VRRQKRRILSYVKNLDIYFRKSKIRTLPVFDFLILKKCSDSKNVPGTNFFQEEKSEQKFLI